MNRPFPSLDRRRFLIATGLGVGATFLGACSAPTSATSAALTPPPDGPVSTEVPIRIYGDDRHPVWHRRALPLDTPRARHPRFPAGTTILKKGTIRREGALPLPCDILVERDVTLRMRDGTTIYTDIYRPTSSEKVPALFGWCPYGKAIGGQWLDDVARRSGVPLSTVSELQRFEGADPAYWVDKGYAVLAPDPRGVGNSGGNIAYWGRQLAEDGYDFVEWIADQLWSSGRVGMTGNSYLAVSQWFIAAERPPHLAAIAPWEGFSDHFREAGNRGGIPAAGFSEQIIATFSGKALVEDQPLMMSKQQTRTPYWLDKEAQVDRIVVPAYVVASWTNPAHTHGTFRGYRGIGSPQKWLRVHNTQEWTDYYHPANVADLQKFFDHFLKGAPNGWEQTPPVRLSVLDPGGTDVVGRVENEFPLARTRYERLYLAQDGTLSPSPIATPTTVRYTVSRTSALTFTTTFDADTEITGYMSLRLWVEAQGADDMELSVSVQKLGADGKPYGSDPMSTIKATGLLRVSQRRLDPASTPSEPLLSNTDEQPLRAGEIVPVDINIWPMGMIYHKGQTLQLTVGVASNPPPAVLPDQGFGTAAITIPADGGTFTPGATVPMVTLGGSRKLPALVAAQMTPAVPSRNAGTHIVHLGGQYDSSLLIPVVPAR